MQDEITKHGIKIYGTAKNPKYTFGEKLKEIIIEICIIVFAVTLSIWLHGWSEHRHEQKEVNEFLRGLKNDLTDDIRLLEENKQVSVNIDSNFNFLLSLKKQTPTKKDTIINHHLYFDVRVTHPKIGRYDGFKSSGKIGIIENDSLKQSILTFYQQTIPDLVDGEEYTNSLQLRILDMQIDKLDDAEAIRYFVTTGKVRGLLEVSAYNLKANIARYNDAITQAKKIISEIDQDENE